MADDQFQIGSGNWWDSPRNRFDSGPSPSSSSALSTSGSFGWPTELVDLKARSSMDSVSVSVSVSDSSASGSNVLAGSTLQMMGLGLSSQTMDWNQPLLQGAKTESSFRSLLQEDQLRSTANFQQETGMGSSSQEQWRHNHRGFSLDQRPVQFGSHISSSSDGVVTCQGLVSTSFQMDPASASYGVPSTILQGLLGTEHHSQQQQQQQQQQLNNYSYPMTYGMNSSEIFPSNSWSKFPQFVRNSPPKQHQSNPFWNANAANSMTDVRSSFFPILQPQFPSPNFDEKPKNISEVRELKTVVKKSSSSSEQSNKRPRSEASSAPLPAFKVRKEKMGDRITALQQLVSPFGKTDTASVLSEAIEYIKFLHEQVNVLSTPYMKSGASMQHQHHQNSDKSKEAEVAKQDLRSRGLCLVPVSSTFPVTHETTVDFWNPTFGGTFR